MKAGVNLIISGHVQGVSFRYHMALRAQALGLTGWVKNRPDGQVEVVAEGDEDGLRSLTGWCRHGPPGACVAGVKVRAEAYTGDFKDFRISG
ncbi:MAG TPA: acylphosphatase [Bacillota bacterium]|jgi:acylphosphatase